MACQVQGMSRAVLVNLKVAPSPIKCVYEREKRMDFINGIPYTARKVQ